MKRRPYLIYLMLSWLLLAAFSLVGASGNEQHSGVANQSASTTAHTEVFP